MKTKNLLLAMTALTTLTLFSCSENEVTDINPDAKPAMTFDVYTGVQTKGKETTTSTIQGNSIGFGVLAYQTTDAWATSGSSASPNLMYNEHVTYSSSGGGGSSWGYTDTKFWPTNNDKITFFAYAPYEDQSASNSGKKTTLSLASATGAPTIEFEVNTELDKMVDLVTDHDKKDKTSSDNSGTVAFSFSHVLTKVILKAKTSSDLGSVTKVYITGVKVVPSVASSESDASKKFYTKATYKFADNAWDYTTGATASTNAIDLSGTNGVLDLKTANTWGYTTSSIDVNSNTTAVDLFKTGEALYFIPVNNTTGLGTAGDVKLKVSYDIVTKVTESTNTKSSTTDKEISLPAGALAKGNSYTYTLIISMHDIKLTGEVSTWTNATSGLDLPTEPEE
ncbi:fimbrillin family protein [Parabacteroides sp.]